MNKFMESRLFLKILSLVFAIGLFAFNSLDTKTIDAFLPTESIRTETVSDVPVKVYYDDEKYMVSGIPETVDVTFKGPVSQLKLALTRAEYEVVADLTAVSAGTYDVTFQVRNLGEDIGYVVKPQKVSVTIVEKSAKESPVSLQVQGKEQLRGAGYVISEATLNKTSATITGAKEEVERVAFLQASVNVKAKTETFTKEVAIIAYDSSGNRMDSVQVTPSKAEATVAITKVGQEAASKSVPINVQTTGTPKNNVFIDSIEVSPEKVTIYGKEADLAGITAITANVDVSAITEDTEKTIILTAPANVTLVVPSRVTAKIQLEKEETRTFSNVQITKRNLANDLNLSFLEPATATVSVTAVPSILDTITKNSIQLFVDAKGLQAGTHDISLQAVSIANAKIDTNNQKIKVELKEKDMPSEEPQEEDQETNGEQEEEQQTEDQQTENQPADDNAQSN